MEQVDCLLLLIGFAVFNLSAYLPDSVVPQYEAIRDQLVSILELFGVAKATSETAAGLSYLCHLIVRSCKTHS